jgi:hypothetical protein
MFAAAVKGGFGWPRELEVLPPPFLRPEIGLPAASGTTCADTGCADNGCADAGCADAGCADANWAKAHCGMLKATATTVTDSSLP